MILVSFLLFEFIEGELQYNKLQQKLSFKLYQNSIIGFFYHYLPTKTQHNTVLEII
jgi:hypothetical protein